MNTLKRTITLLTPLCFSVLSMQAQSTDDLKKAIHAEHYTKAKQLGQNLTKANPGNAENFFYLGKAYLLSGQPDSAQISFDKGIAANPEFALNYVGNGAVQLQDERTAALAGANFTKALSVTKKKDERTHYFIGEAWMNAAKPDYEQALAHFNEAIALNKKNAEVMLAIGDAFHGMARNSEAYSQYVLALERDPGLLAARLRLGVLVKESRAFQESEKQLKAILETDSTYAPAYRELAETYYLWANTERKTYDQNIKKALETYRHYMAYSDNSLESKMRYADFLILAKDYAALEKVANEMAALESKNLRILRYLGYAAYENGNFPESEKALTQFIGEVEPERIIGRDYLYLANSELELGKDSIATLNIIQAVNRDSSLYEDIKPAAKRLYTAKNYRDAASVYELAVKDPESKTLAYDNFYLGMSYYFDYANQYRDSRDTTKSVAAPDTLLLVKADTAFARVTTLSPTSADAWLYRGRINRLLDNEENPQGKMVPFYEKYIELVTAKENYESDARVKSTLIEAYSNLGAFDAKKEDKEAAKAYFTKVLALDPQNAYATSSLEYLAQQ
jgi:tetratricopeptide (TPR) repeat protein